MSYGKARDQRIADTTTVHEEYALLCKYPSCLKRWSVKLDGADAMCSEHAWDHTPRGPSSAYIDKDRLARAIANLSAKWAPK